MKKLLLLVFSVISLFATDFNDTEKEFSLINPQETQNILGNTIITGNTVACISEFNESNPSTSIEKLQNSPCSNNLNHNTNKYFVKYIDVDNNGSTFNSSTATLQFPNTYKKIKWAGLFWQGNLNNISKLYKKFNGEYVENNDSSLSNEQNFDTFNEMKNKGKMIVLMKIGTNSYKKVEAPKVSYSEWDFKAIYGAYANVTDYLKEQNITGGEVNVTIANIPTSRGLETGLGNFDAWVLVVVYEEDSQNPNSKYRNNSIYFGYKKIYKSESIIKINDLFLPKFGDVESKVAIFAGEGEYPYKPDELSLYNGQNYIKFGSDSNCSDGNYPSCKNNVFDAKLSPTIKRFPFLKNNNGIDIVSGQILNDDRAEKK